MLIFKSVWINSQFQMKNYTEYIFINYFSVLNKLFQSRQQAKIWTLHFIMPYYIIHTFFTQSNNVITTLR